MSDKVPEPIEKCNKVHTMKLYPCELEAGHDSEKITDETVLWSDESGSTGLTLIIKEVREPYRTMLLTSAEKDAKIKELEACLSQFVRAVRFTSGVSLEFATSDAEKALKKLRER